MPPIAVYVVSIHDRKGSVLAVDLKEVLQALDECLREWIWCLTILECTGGEYCASVCDAVENAGEAGLWISGQEILRLADDVVQTIEGEGIAFPTGIDRQAITAADLDVAFFPTSRAELAIRVVDSSFVEVYAKDVEVINRLTQRFRDVRLQDPSPYFDAV